MDNMQPHEIFRSDFDSLLIEAKRQESLDPANAGEEVIAARIYEYIDNIVIPLILGDDTIFNFVSSLVTDYSEAYFNTIGLTAREAYRTQKSLLSLKSEVSIFLKINASQQYRGMELDLQKISDFVKFIDLEKIDNHLRMEADRLYNRARDHEKAQLTVTMRTIRDNYELGLPRLMFVIRPILLQSIGKSTEILAQKLLQPSDYINNTFRVKADPNHPFWPVIGDEDLVLFYRLCRNTASHHTGHEWDPDQNIVILRDGKNILPIHIREFHQRSRFLVYLTDYCLRGLFSAFCEVDKGSLSDDLLDRYNKTFPSDFLSDEQANISYYSR